MNTIWILIIIAGVGAGHQIGPFASFEQCDKARYEYNVAQSPYLAKGHASVCVQAVAVK